MVNPKNEVREYLEKLVRQYLFITGMNKQLKIMREWESPNRFEALNEGSYFFRLVSYSFTRTFLIEIAKFISDKEDKSLIDFLEKAKINAKSIFPQKHNSVTDSRDQISPEEFIDIIDQQFYEIESHNEIIANIKARRDKVLAHSDSKYFNNQNIIYEHYPISLTDIDNLMITINDILRTHYDYLLGSDPDLEVKSTGNIDNVLINNRAFRRVWRDKNIIKCGIRPIKYRLDDYSNKNEY